MKPSLGIESIFPLYPLHLQFKCYYFSRIDSGIFLPIEFLYGNIVIWNIESFEKIDPQNPSSYSVFSRVTVALLNIWTWKMPKMIEIKRFPGQYWHWCTALTSYHDDVRSRQNGKIAVYHIIRSFVLKNIELKVSARTRTNTRWSSRNRIHNSVL